MMNQTTEHYNREKSVVVTAYGIGFVGRIEEIEKRQMISDISDCLSVRNTKQVAFAKELNKLITKYKK